jgi:hypothetical protein
MIGRCWWLDLPSSPQAAKRLNQQATEIEQLRQRHAASVFPEIGWCQQPMYELCKVNTPENMALDVGYTSIPTGDLLRHVCLFGIELGYCIPSIDINRN